MSRPNRDITVHSCFFDQQASRVKQAICLLAQDNSLNASSIQAMRVLADAYEALSNPLEEIQRHYQADCKKTASEQHQGR